MHLPLLTLLGRLAKNPQLVVKEGKVHQTLLYCKLINLVESVSVFTITNALPCCKDKLLLQVDKPQQNSEWSFKIKIMHMYEKASILQPLKLLGTRNLGLLELFTGKFLT